MEGFTRAKDSEETFPIKYLVIYYRFQLARLSALLIKP